MSRNFGIMSGRSALGGTSDRPSAGDAKQYNRAGSNVVELFPSPPVAVDSADADFGALCFAIAAFWSPMVLVGVGLVIWSLFF
jgi:hypothetical protein